MKRSTQVIHAGTERDPYGSVTTSVSRSGTSGFASVDEAAALERRMAALEGAGDCVVTASGIGAISTVMWTFLKPGDHLLADTALHGDTHALFAHALTRFGIEVDGVDFNDVDRVRDALKANTAIVYFESPCNPTLKVNDIAALSALAHTHHPHVRVVVDNSFATPYLQNPLALGANLVVHSTTKYLGGHGDGVGGCICGTKADVARLRFDGIGHATGAMMAPDNAYLVLRGIATLSVRMERHCDNAAKIARYLAGSPHVARVHYPGLAADPGHAVAVTQMRAPGGMVALELAGSFEQAKAFVNGLKLIRIAVSPGGVESVIEHPASMTHARLAPDERPAAGIAPTLVRVSVGIEDVDDLIGDLEQAFRAMGD
ncbi:methionine-gamma-lyase [Paraburkholderia caballeronis]|uniref:trans-sulfuration enzyme family protein n=1 Tax=Paraburkholderia caballeronis TaxID=416943 RepID=UPI0010647E36|nr:aminotransferase class I/II-fold pyridoxal phosphate-dependent enzyme [Paraburkholderia caballeronis]TDV28489.1 methionine-gamma-lyase [Paraburkholderia caballeronis]